MMRKLPWVPGALCAALLSLSSPALAEDDDLNRTVSDLSGQAGDKEKMDSLGAAKIEISQMRGWLDAAVNAIKEDTKQKARRMFELVRAQLTLVDGLVSLSKAKDELGRLEQESSRARQALGKAKSKLEEKRAELRALKINEGKK
jgi:hypothetical protein